MFLQQWKESLILGICINFKDANLQFKKKFSLENIAGTFPIKTPPL
jgi:hypothetical protein